MVGAWESRTVAVLGGFGVFIWSLALFWTMEHSSYDRWGALLVLLVVVLLSAVLYPRAARRDGAPGMLALLWVALALKLLASGARYLVAFRLYDGAADSARYHEAGQTVAAALREGQLVDLGSWTGTQFLEQLTGFLYTLTGPTLIGAFVVFAWAALWGQWLFYRAYRTAFPAAPPRRFAVLVMLWPSLLFWPSSVGKESVMLLALGATAYGASRIYAGHLAGVVPLALGTGLSAFVRPHMALMIGVAVVAGMLAYRARRRTAITPLVRIVGLALCGAAVALLASHATQFFADSRIDPTSLDSVLTKTAERTSVGHSEFTPTPVTSPAALPPATITVLLRPFPWEAHNVVSLIAASESLLMCGLLALSWRSLLRALRMVPRTPMLAMAVAYLFVFIIAYSTFGNFGLLARERTQALPFLLMLCCLPLAPRRRASNSPPATTRAAVNVTYEGARS